MSDKRLIKSEDSFDEKADFDYKPSNWPCLPHSGWSPSDVLTHYSTACSNGASYVYSTYTKQISTVRYGDGSCEEIDIVSPLSSSTADNCSLLAYFHGGYWQQGHFREHSMHLARPVVQAGHYFAGIGYLDSTEQLPLASIVEQAACAVNKLSDFASTHNISCVVLFGHSAGAHLTAMTLSSAQLSQSSRDLITGVVLLSGVYDLQPLMNTSINISGLAMHDGETAQKLSPLYRLDFAPMVLANLSKVVIGYGESESPAFKSQATQYMKKLQALGLSCQLFVGAAKDHFTFITDAHVPDDPVAKELVAILDELNGST